MSLSFTHPLTWLTYRNLSDIKVIASLAGFAKSESHLIRNVLEYLNAFGVLYINRMSTVYDKSPKLFLDFLIF